MFLRVEKIGGTLPTGKILDKNGGWCGEVSFDGYDELDFFDSEGPWEFILLSLHVSDHGWSQFNVMLIEWRHGIAERRGISQVSATGFSVERGSFPPGPVWKEIVLG